MIESVGKASICKKLLPQLDFKAVQRTCFTQVKFTEDGKEVKVFVEDDEKLDPKPLHLRPGDTCEINHTTTINGSTQIEKDHPFPIKLTYFGEDYYLRQTKNNKLILTK